MPAIHSADKNKPPIEDVHFEFRDNSRPVLVVNIPDGHPQGVYHGAIVDSKTREPGGFISVRVFEEDKHWGSPRGEAVRQATPALVAELLEECRLEVLAP